MTEIEYRAEKASIGDAKRFGMISARDALRRLVIIQGKRDKTILDEARERKLKREG